MKPNHIWCAVATAGVLFSAVWIAHKWGHSAGGTIIGQPLVSTFAGSQPLAAISSEINITVNRENHQVASATKSDSSPLTKTIAFITSRLRDWKAETNPDRRKEILDELLPLVTDENIVAITKSLSPELLDTDFGSAVINRWAGVDRQSAAEWMAAQPGTTAFQAGLITYGWLQQDAEGMRKYLDDLPAGDWRENVLNSAANNALTANDPLEAIRCAGKMQDNGGRNTMLNSAVEQWAQTDPQAAAKWAAEISDPQLRGELENSIAAGLAATDPVQAAELVVQSIASGQPMTKAVADLAGIWSATDPAAAAGWVTLFPEGPTRQLALQILMNQWGSQNLPGTENWVENLPPGQFRDEAETVFASVKSVIEAN